MGAEAVEGGGNYGGALLGGKGLGAAADGIVGLVGVAVEEGGNEPGLGVGGVVDKPRLDVAGAGVAHGRWWKQ